MGVFGGYEGKMHIEDGKKELFIRQMSRILNLGGMMEFEMVRMYGKEIALLRPFHVDSGGEMDFHYNYFEEDAWESAGFDTKDCILWSGKIGSAEFNDVIMAGYFLYEMYDEGAGYAAIDGDVVDTAAYAGWLNRILGTDFSMGRRFQVWKFAEEKAFARLENGYDGDSLFDRGDLDDIIPRGYRYMAGGMDYTDLLYLLYGTADLEKDGTEEGTYPDDVRRCRKEVAALFVTYQEDGADRLWVFLTKNYDERAEEEDVFLKEIAKLSLFMPARVFVYLAAELGEGIRFWKIWKEWKDQFYTDEHRKQYASKKLEKWRAIERREPVDPILTSDFLRQDGVFLFWDTPEELKGEPKYYISDDDRLYWWDGSDEVRISEETDNWLKELGRQHGKIMESLSKEDTEQAFLPDFLMLLSEINEYYMRIFPFQSMYYDFLQNGNKKEYVAAVRLLKSLADDKDNRRTGAVIQYKKSSWELTSRKVTHNPARLLLKRYLAVMANKKLRERYFGF